MPENAQLKAEVQRLRERDTILVTDMEERAASLHLAAKRADEFRAEAKRLERERDEWKDAVKVAHSEVYRELITKSQDATRKMLEETRQKAWDDLDEARKERDESRKDAYFANKVCTEAVATSIAAYKEVKRLEQTILISNFNADKLVGHVTRLEKKLKEAPHA